MPVAALPKRTATPLVDYLTAALDHKLSTIRGESAKVRFLAAAYGNWSLNFHKFECCGVQPFGGPHPTLGDMDAFDFRLLLTEIDSRRYQLEREAA